MSRGTWPRCPKCGNCQRGTTIYECANQRPHSYFCGACKSEKGLMFTYCPHCQTTAKVRSVGEIG